ncbi:MAG TPA: hypothetical protein VI032_15035 [Burkholderiaceae bacterium]
MRPTSMTPATRYDRTHHRTRLCEHNCSARLGRLGRWLSDLPVAQVAVFDAYALWTFKPGVALRLSANNWAARDYTTGGSLDFESALGAATRETTRTVVNTYVQWQLRLELKL